MPFSDQDLAEIVVSLGFPRGNPPRDQLLVPGVYPTEKEISEIGEVYRVEIPYTAFDHSREFVPVSMSACFGESVEWLRLTFRIDLEKKAIDPSYLGIDGSPAAKGKFIEMNGFPHVGRDNPNEERIIQTNKDKDLGSGLPIAGQMAGIVRQAVTQMFNGEIPLLISSVLVRQPPQARSDLNPHLQRTH